MYSPRTFCRAELRISGKALEGKISSTNPMLGVEQADTVGRQSLDLIHITIRKNDQVAIRLQDLEGLARELQILSVNWEAKAFFCTR